MTDDDLKSQKTVMVNLIKGLLTDLGLQHSVSKKETDHDGATIVRRTEAEGLSFLMKTLPKYGKALDKALLAGKFTPMSEFGHDSGVAYPRLFRGIAKLVFEEDGTLKGSPDVAAVQSLRQVSYIFYKYDLPYQDRTVRLAVEEFRAVDDNISIPDPTAESMSTIYYAQEVLNEVFSTFDCQISGYHTLRPKNGPGAVAHGEKPWQRYEPRRYYECLDRLIPYGEFFFFSPCHFLNRFGASWVNLDLPEDLGTAELLAVPKDSRGPRLISKEPQEFMCYQQAMKRELVAFLEASPLTGGQVNFTDQTINGQLALRASVDGSLATLDLSAASDRLGLWLVEALFEDLPCLQHYLLTARSANTKLPDGYIQPLKKYGPMGSALTFPVQAVCFWALLVGGLVRGGMPLRHAAKAVWVYGDDIIVANEYAPEAIEILESMGLKVNTDKSCYSGHFRESCGVDAFLGTDVTPVKVKARWQHRRPEITTIQSWVAYSDNLFEKGYWHAQEVINLHLEKALGRNLPRVTSTSPLLGLRVCSKERALEANDFYRIPKMWDLDWQTYIYGGYHTVSETRLRLFDGWQRLLNWAWNSEPEPAAFTDYEKAPFATGLFTDRYTVTKQWTWVAESSV